MKTMVCLCLLAGAAWASAQNPTPNEVYGKPFFVKNTWVIGGEGNWDNLAVDAGAQRLYIAHGPVVQVVDLETGALAGRVEGLQDARSVTLDDSGDTGFVSDVKAGKIVFFDRRTQQIKSSIPIPSAPRALVFDAQDKLLFAISYQPPPPVPLRTESLKDPNGQPIRMSDGKIVTYKVPDRSLIPKSAARPETFITVIRTETQAIVGHIAFSGQLSSAVIDRSGQLFLGVSDRNYLLHLDVPAIASRFQRGGSAPAVTIDWRDVETGDAAHNNWDAPGHPDIYSLLPACDHAANLAIDSRQQRLFIACENRKLVVLNALRGEALTFIQLNTVPDALAYDPDRSLLYAANGSGTLTIFLQHVTDSFAFIQDLPTLAQARTLAVNPVSGNVYLVTNRTGFTISKPGGPGTLTTAPVQGSFQILVVGN